MRSGCIKIVTLTHMPQGHVLFVKASRPESPIHRRLVKEGTAFLEWDFLCPRRLPPAKPYAYIALANWITDSPNEGYRLFLVLFFDLPLPDLRAPDFLPERLGADLRLPADFFTPDRLAPDFLGFPFLPPKRDDPLRETPSICYASCLTSSDTCW